MSRRFLRASVQGVTLLTLLALLASCAVSSPHVQASSPAARSHSTAGPRVRLVLLVVADQFRADNLTRFGPLPAGFRTLMSRGAVFTDAHVEHALTVTAVGHATMLTGAMPSVSGIIDNAWYERTSKSRVESVTDQDVQIVGGDADAGIGASPRQLLVTTLGDQLKLTSGVAPGRPDAPKVIGISLKDRSAILSAGHAADGAYFLRGGRFVTSTYYRPDLPAWVADLNGRQLPESYAGKRWEFEGGVHEYPSEIGVRLYEAVTISPAGNELVLALARAALQHERLGQRGVTDVLTVSFTSNDLVGHKHGSESPEARDITRQTDKQLQQLLDEVEQRVGLAHTLVAFTADHGAGPTPEIASAMRLPAGRFKTQAMTEAIETALDARFGTETWIERTQHPHVYLDHALLVSRGIDAAEARRVAADAAARVPHVARVYTRDAILAGQVPADQISSRVTHGYHRDRSGDLHVVLEPLWTTAPAGASHGTPYHYDAHIPLMLMGPGIVPGTYSARVALNDLAPTLAALLGVEAPAGSTGRVLHEALQRVPPLAGPTSANTSAP